MSEHPAELVCSRLGDVHPKSGGGYTAKCPAHEDDHESLSIDEGDDGRALLKCFAGCDIQAIVKGLGLTTKDLFERRNGGGEGATLLSRKTRTLEHLAKKSINPRM
jgi:hypothetical protein